MYAVFRDTPFFEMSDFTKMHYYGFSAEGI